MNIDLNTLYADDANQVDGPLAKLAGIVSEEGALARKFEDDASTRIQEISTSGQAYQQWRVEPFGMLGQSGVDSGEEFIKELTKANSQIPTGNLLGSRGQVSGYNQLDEDLTYFAADSRILRDSVIERIEPNPLHPLDFVGVRVELSKSFSVRDIKEPEATSSKTVEELTLPIVKRTEA